MSVRVSFDLPDEVAALLGSPEAAARAAKQALALHLLREGEISQGKAARLLGLTRGDILDLMVRYEIPAGPATPEEWDQEMETIESLAAERFQHADRQ